VIQSRNKAKKLKHEFLADAREFGWNFLAAYTGRGIRDRFGGQGLGKVKERLGGGLELAFYRLLSAAAGSRSRRPTRRSTTRRRRSRRAKPSPSGRSRARTT
jgi:hypothetical protein